MKVVVGLGNPGKKYRETRHNVGFMVLEELSRRHQGGSPQSKFESEIVEIHFAGQNVLLVAPQTFMNLSGRAVGKLMSYYSTPLSDLLVISDDLNLETGRLRLRASGTSGGQKGLEDLIRCLGTDEFPRLRIGIDRPPTGWNAADYVLGRFGGSEREKIKNAVLTACEGVEVWVKDGLPEAMNRMNGLKAGG